MDPRRNSTTFDPERGRAAARTRWGPPKVLRIASLDPVTREIVEAVLAARENQRLRDEAHRVQEPAEPANIK